MKCINKCELINELSEVPDVEWRMSAIAAHEVRGDGDAA